LTKPRTDKSYTVTWHAPSPKTYFAGYSKKEAVALQKKVRNKHSMFAVTIQREIKE
jgi:hypothetical protein